MLLVPVIDQVDTRWSHYGAHLRSELIVLPYISEVRLVGGPAIGQGANLRDLLVVELRPNLAGGVR